MSNAHAEKMEEVTKKLKPLKHIVKHCLINQKNTF